MNVIYNDVHVGSSIQLMDRHEFTRSVIQDLKRGHHVILLGDNFDLAGCKKSEVKKLLLLRDHLKAMRAQLVGQKYSGVLQMIDGNHERCETSQEIAYIGTDMFVHGDHLKWGPDRAIRYRKGKHGAGLFKRKFVIPVIEWAEQFGINRVTERMRTNAKHLALNSGARRVICGHVHPKKRLLVDVGSGVTLIVLPRGRNVL